LVLLGIMLLVIFSLHLPRFSLGSLMFLLHCFLEDLIVLALVAPIRLLAPIFLSLLVLRFLLGGNLNLGDNLRLGGNLKVDPITQFMGKVYLCYNINLGIFLSKGINNCMGGNILKVILLYPLISENHI
jgi:hypothetical protein